MKLFTGSIWDQRWSRWSRGRYLSVWKEQRILLKYEFVLKKSGFFERLPSQVRRYHFLSHQQLSYLIGHDQPGWITDRHEEKVKRNRSGVADPVDARYENGEQHEQIAHSNQTEQPQVSEWLDQREWSKNWPLAGSQAEYGPNWQVKQDDDDGDLNVSNK